MQVYPLKDHIVHLVTLLGALLSRNAPLTTSVTLRSALKIKKISVSPVETEDSGPPLCLHKDAYRASERVEENRTAHRFHF